MCMYIIIFSQRDEPLDSHCLTYGIYWRKAWFHYALQHHSILSFPPTASKAISHNDTFHGGTVCFFRVPFLFLLLCLVACFTWLIGGFGWFWIWGFSWSNNLSHQVMIECKTTNNILDECRYMLMSSTKVPALFVVGHVYHPYRGYREAFQRPIEGDRHRAIYKNCIAVGISMRHQPPYTGTGVRPYRVVGQTIHRNVRIESISGSQRPC